MAVRIIIFFKMKAINQYISKLSNKIEGKVVFCDITTMQYVKPNASSNIFIINGDEAYTNFRKNLLNEKRGVNLEDESWKLFLNLVDEEYVSNQNLAEEIKKYCEEDLSKTNSISTSLNNFCKSLNKNSELENIENITAKYMAVSIIDYVVNNQEKLNDKYIVIVPPPKLGKKIEALSGLKELFKTEPKMIYVKGNADAEYFKSISLTTNVHTGHYSKLLNLLETSNLINEEVKNEFLSIVVNKYIEPKNQIYKKLELFDILLKNPEVDNQFTQYLNTQLATRRNDLSNIQGVKVEEYDELNSLYLVNISKILEKNSKLYSNNKDIIEASANELYSNALKNKEENSGKCYNKYFVIN